MKKDHNQLNWLMVSLIAFNMVWGLGNVVNNYSTQGISVIVSWILILAIYFIPYALIVGQLGSKDLYKTSCLFCGLDLLGCTHSLFSPKTSTNFDFSRLGSSRK